MIRLLFSTPNGGGTRYPSEYTHPKLSIYQTHGSGPKNGKEKLSTETEGLLKAAKTDVKATYVTMNCLT